MHIIQGMIVGFSIAAPVGAIGFLCIQQTLVRGILVGVASGLGAATADMMYGIIVALGLKATQTLLLTYKTPLSIGGGLFFCYLGIKKFFAVPSIARNTTALLLDYYTHILLPFFLHWQILPQS